MNAQILLGPVGPERTTLIVALLRLLKAGSERQLAEREMHHRDKRDHREKIKGYRLAKKCGRIDTDRSTQCTDHVYAPERDRQKRAEYGREHAVKEGKLLTYHPALLGGRI